MAKNRKLSWFGLVVSLLATQVLARDFQLTLWNSSDCTRGDPSTESNILQIPWDNDDPNQGFACADLKGTIFNGWTKDTHSQQVIAYVDTLAIAKGCEVVFYNRGPPADQLPEQIATGPCWQAYRRVSRSSACPSVTFDAENIAMSYCCGTGCRVARGYDGVSDPVLPYAPPLPRGLERSPKAISKLPLQSHPQPGNNSKRSGTDVSKCQFKNSTEVRYTYLPSVQVDNLLQCPSGQDLGGGPCSWDEMFSTEVQLMSSSSLSVSESIQAGIEGIFSETTTLGFDISSSATNGQTVSASETLTLPQGRWGFPSFKQVLQCTNGTFSGCDVKELTSLPNQEYCLPVLAPATKQGRKAIGLFTMVDTT